MRNLYLWTTWTEHHVVNNGSNLYGPFILWKVKHIVECMIYDLNNKNKKCYEKMVLYVCKKSIVYKTLSEDVYRKSDISYFIWDYLLISKDYSLMNMDVTISSLVLLYHVLHNLHIFLRILDTRSNTETGISFCSAKRNTGFGISLCSH